METGCTQNFRHILGRLSDCKCLAMKCEGATSGDIHMYSFPKDFSTLKKWCDNLKTVNPERINTTSRVCSRHFDSSNIGKLRLKKGAMPTLNLGHDDKKLYHYVTPICKRVSNRKCSVRKCSNSSINGIMYRFPTCPNRRQAWIEACGLVHSTVKNLYICAKHFNDSDMTPRKYKRAAFPVYDLGNDSESIHSDVSIKDVQANEQGCDSCIKFGKLAIFYRKKYMDLKTRLMEKETLHLKAYEDLLNRITALEVQIESLRTSSKNREKAK